MSHPILLYDGVCGLCNRLVQFVLRRDPHGIFHFAALQSPLAEQILTRHGGTPQTLDTVYLTLNPGLPDEQLLTRSDAILFVLQQLGGIWRVFAATAKLFPGPFRDLGYNLIARNRYRIFGRYDTCPIPSAETRSRFLDM